MQICSCYTNEHDCYINFSLVKTAKFSLVSLKMTSVEGMQNFHTDDIS